MIDMDTLTTDRRVLAKALELAAGYIERHGWWQKAYANPDATGDCQVCAAGGINVVAVGAAEGWDHASATGRYWRHTLSTEVKVALLDHLGLGWQDCEHDDEHGGYCRTCDKPGWLAWITDLDVHVGRWNDEPGQTELGVLAGLRGAAIALREQGGAR